MKHLSRLRARPGKSAGVDINAGVLSLKLMRLVHTPHPESVKQ